MNRLVCRRTWLWAAVALCVGGCQIKRGDSGFPNQQVPDAVEGSGGDVDTGVRSDVSLGAGEGAGTMTGTWVLIHDRSTCVLGTNEQITRAVYRVRLDAEGTSIRRISEQRHLCDISLSRVLGQRIEISDDVLDSITNLSLDEAWVSTVETGGTYVSSTEAGFWGLDPEKMKDPVDDPLPKKADDPAVVDADGDGNPAVSFAVNDGDCVRYNAQRQVIRYLGEFTTPNQIDGQSTGDTDLRIYDASKSYCEINAPISSNDGHSTFRMYRIDGKGGAVDADTDGDDAISCEEIEALPLAEAKPRPMPDNARCRN